MKYSDNLGWRLLLGVPLAFLFFTIRGIEGHFGPWSMVTFILMFTGPPLILAVMDRLALRRTERGGQKAHRKDGS